MYILCINGLIYNIEYSYFDCLNLSPIWPLGIWNKASEAKKNFLQTTRSFASQELHWTVLSLLHFNAKTSTLLFVDFSPSPNFLPVSAKCRGAWWSITINRGWKKKKLIGGVIRLPQPHTSQGRAMIPNTMEKKSQSQVKGQWQRQRQGQNKDRHSKKIQMQWDSY